MKDLPLDANQFAITLALMANIFFGLSCIVFAKFTEILGTTWVNTFKALVSTFCFLGTSIALGYAHTFQFHQSFVFLFFSGMLGLAIADIFLLTSLRHNGVGETLIFYSFQPFLIYLASHILWDERLKSSQWVGVCIFCLCLIIFCLDKYKKSKLQLRYAFMALTAILLDTCGVLMTKHAYAIDPGMNSVVASTHRGLGAILALFILSKITNVSLVKGWKSLSYKHKWLILLSAFTGTFLSLLFYLKAIQIGTITLITAVSVATPLWATFFEFFYYKKRPTNVFLICFSLYCFAFLWNFFQWD